MSPRKPAAKAVVRHTATKTFTLPPPVDEGLDTLAAIYAERDGAGRRASRSDVIVRLVLAALKAEERREQKKES